MGSSLEYSLISLQPGITMERCKLALKVAAKTKLIFSKTTCAMIVKIFHYIYGNINFLIIIHPFIVKKMPVMPALCSILRL